MNYTSAAKASTGGSNAPATTTPSTSLSDTTPSDPSAPGSQHRIFAPSSTGTAQAAQYTLSSLSRSSLNPDPLAQFHAWFAHASSNGVYQPETVCLSTASLPSGSVSSRFVYLKTLDDTGFVVYTNMGTSRKAADLSTNPHASLAFWWREVERQVRVEGRVERLTRAESQVYYATRARGSKLGAYASRQSQVLRDRDELDGWVAEEERRWEGTEDIPVPEFWGGVRIVPERIEFWQGRESRLHDRFRYTRTEQGWEVDRLSP